MHVKFFAALSFLLSVVGCAETPRSQESSLVGQCKQLVEPQQIYETSCWSGDEKYMISSKENAQDECLQGGVLGELNSGKKIKVVNVISLSWGASGYCWRVMVEILDGPQQNMVVDIPACAFGGRPHPRWLEDTLATNANSLVIKKELAVDVECP